MRILAARPSLDPHSPGTPARFSGTGRLQWPPSRTTLRRKPASDVNGLSLLVMLVLAVGIVIAWRAGVMQGRREGGVPSGATLRPAVAAQPPAAAPTTPAESPRAIAESPPPASEPAPPAAQPATPAVIEPVGRHDAVADEQSRLVRALTLENARLRAGIDQAVGAARAETARYRELVIDIENNAKPPLLDGPTPPDDLKLIVGIGPVLEQLLHKMGIATYRQIARWTERDIDDVDARLPEFPGRIRRDAWVTQARELHQSKFGETLPTRDR